MRSTASILTALVILSAGCVSEPARERGSAEEEAPGSVPPSRLPESASMERCGVSAEARFPLMAERAAESLPSGFAPSPYAGVETGTAALAMSGLTCARSDVEGAPSGVALMLLWAIEVEPPPGLREASADRHLAVLGTLHFPGNAAGVRGAFEAWGLGLTYGGNLLIASRSNSVTRAGIVDASTDDSSLRLVVSAATEPAPGGDEGTRIFGVVEKALTSVLDLTVEGKGCAPGAAQLFVEAGAPFAQLPHDAPAGSGNFCRLGSLQFRLVPNAGDPASRG